MSVTKEQVFEFIDNMTILDMSKFIKEFEERYGVTAAAPVAVAAAAPGAAAPAAEEKTSFDVVLAGAGDKKIQVIKVVRELDRTWPERGKRPCRWRTEAGQDGYFKRRGRCHEGETGGAGSKSRNKVENLIQGK